MSKRLVPVNLTNYDVAAVLQGWSDAKRKSYDVRYAWHVRVDGETVGYLFSGRNGYFGTDLKGQWVTCWYIAPKTEVRDLVIARVAGQ
jgi:hypothetical protein